MTEDPEPTENISGGSAGSGVPTEFDPAEADSRAEAVVDRLGQMYWTKTYGGQDAFECLVRTILSQNTSDVASQPAHDALMERYGGREARSASKRSSGERSEPRDDGGTETDLADALAHAEQPHLAETISSAGLYNQKSARIIEIADRVVEEYGSAAAFDEFVRDEDPEDVRETLLDMNGVGPKTADCVLLFAGGRSGVFPVDTHVHRISRRLGVASADADHEGVRAALEDAVPAEKCGFGHTAMIQFGREYCTARKPACLDGPEACPMEDVCDQVGVSPEDGDVQDPRDVAERG